MLITTLAVAAALAGSPAQRPSEHQAHVAANLAMADFAELVDGRLAITRCGRRGHHSQRCRFAINGRQPFGGRVVVTKSGGDFWVRAWIYAGTAR